jgi:ABC-2 type transport system permease protein
MNRIAATPPVPAPLAAAQAAPRPRHLGAVNWLGLWTLTAKEIRRFLKVYMQTVLAPVVTTLMFLAIFLLSVGRSVVQIHDIPFPTFLAPGLIMMAMVQNAFANTSSSLIIAKVQGNIVDTLMPPLSPLELTIAFALGGVARGVVVGVVVALSILPFVSVTITNPWLIAYYGVGASLMLSLLGIMGAIWADKFDHMAAVTNFVVLPLSFLSGTFYSIDRLPETIRVIAFVNPFFYMIDGFRAGFIGRADGSLLTGGLVMGIVDLVLLAATFWMFRTGYKLKA